VRLRILLVEDSELLRAVLSTMLEGEGHTVVAASNGGFALRLLENDRFDLVVTDIVMPEVDGLEVVRALRKMKSRPGVIAMSGEGRAGPFDYLAMAALLGADETLVKPFAVAELKEAIGRVMRLSSVRR
jgi:CheY-like chemotaxis protein